MEIDIDSDSIKVYKALSSEVRLALLRSISHGTTTSKKLAKDLHLTQSAVSKNIRILLDAGLIKTEDSTDNRKKVLKLAIQNIDIQLSHTLFPEYHQVTYSIPVGNYFNIEGIHPSCGLVNDKSVILRFDDPTTFLSPERISAQLLWFTSGEVEYQVPLKIPKNAELKMLDISFEAASEFPGSNNNWPSEITFSVNNKDLGKFTVKGNFSDVRGKYTPKWWDDRLSQYGTLVQLRISEHNTGFNGVKFSDFTIKGLNIHENNTVKFKLSVPALRNQTPHGLTLFGSKFGNYPQDILVNSYWSKPASE